MKDATANELLLSSIFGPLGIGRTEREGDWLRGRLGYGPGTASVWARIAANGEIDVCVSATLAGAFMRAVRGTLGGEPPAGAPFGAIVGGRLLGHAALHDALAQTTAAADPARMEGSGTQQAEIGANDHLAQAAETLESAATEAARLIQARVGQERFRQDLLRHWQGRCAVTDLAVAPLLRASHCKPWADSSSAERLNPYNGLLLAAHLDAAFDGGFITVAADAAVVVSPALGPADRACLGLNVPLRVSRLEAPHEKFLAWHRAHVFRAVRGPEDGPRP